MKKALIHDWLYVYGGAEKVLESFTNIWGDADIFTLIDYLDDNDRQKILKGKRSNTSFIQKLPFSKTKHRNYLPLFPLAIEQFDLSEFDLILSSSYSVAKGVLTNANQLHISYVHSPIRYAWDLYHQYLKTSGLEKGFKGLIAKYFLHKIRMWDFSTVNRVDHYIANSKYIANRIKKIYNRDAEVIYPPVNVDKFTLNENKEEFYFTASRMVPYKKIDLIVESFAKMPDKKLIVVGDGPDMKKIKSKATKNIEILGFQSSEILIDLMQRAKAFIFAAEEDFGIVPVEAQACGTPVICLNKGGTKETVEDGVSGMHFKNQTIADIIGAVGQFEKNQDNFFPEKVRENALKFGRERFENEIENFVKLKYQEFLDNRK